MTLYLCPGAAALALPAADFGDMMGKGRDASVRFGSTCLACQHLEKRRVFSCDSTCSMTSKVLGDAKRASALYWDCPHCSSKNDVSGVLRINSSLSKVALL